MSNKPIDELLYGSLRGAVISAIDRADSYYEEALAPNTTQEMFIAQAKTFSETVYRRKVFDYLMFIDVDYYGTPHPKAWQKRAKNEHYKYTDEDLKEIDAYYKEEYERSHRYISSKVLELAKATNIKPYQETLIVGLMATEAQKHFERETSDNEGLLRVARGGLSDLTDKVYNLIEIGDRHSSTITKRNTIDHNLFGSVVSILDTATEKIAKLENSSSK